jgi:hypothetical protein
MQLAVEDEFYPEFMALLEPLIEEEKIEILESFWEENEDEEDYFQCNSLNK